MVSNDTGFKIRIYGLSWIILFIVEPYIPIYVSNDVSNDVRQIMVKVTLKSIFYTLVNLEKVKLRRDRGIKKRSKTATEQGSYLFLEKNMDVHLSTASCENESLLVTQMQGDFSILLAKCINISANSLLEMQQTKERLKRLKFWQ